MCGPTQQERIDANKAEIARYHRDIKAVNGIGPGSTPGARALAEHRSEQIHKAEKSLHEILDKGY